ncbi:MAG: NADPH:quinone oxidoreductase family protein [Flavobacteriales bacterium]
MKALVCKSYDKSFGLEFQTLETPKPKRDEILVKIEAAALNFPDTLTIQGKDQYGLTLPFIPGREYSGQVVEVGSSVLEFKEGDRVMVDAMSGAFQEYACSNIQQTHKIPDKMSYESAAAFGITYGTAYHALVDRGNAKSGETVAILGASGGVGFAALQLAKLLKLNTIACVGFEEKKIFCLEQGADEALNYTTEDLKLQLKVLTEGNGADLICDMVGSPHTEPAFRAMAWGGRFLVIGFAAGSIAKLPLNLPLLKGASAVGVFFSTFTQKFPEQHKENMAKLLNWVAEGKLAPHIHTVYPFDQTPLAFNELTERRVKGKVVIKMS